MGRYYYDKKDVTEDYLQLSVAKLREWGYLEPNQFRSGSVQWTRGWAENKSSIGISVSTFPDDMYVRLNYTNTSGGGEKKQFDYKVPLTTTPCTFGGVRYWFVCPLNKQSVYCGKRVGKLYGGSWFGCRHCYNLSYESRNENRHGGFYAFGRLLDIRRKTDELRQNTKRWTYAGRPTKKALKYQKLETQGIQLIPAVVRFTKEMEQKQAWHKTLHKVNS